MKRLVLLVLAALALAPLPGRAATINVSLTGNSMVPEVRDGLVAGDEITFHVFDGTHHLVALQNGSFDTGPLNAGDEYVLPYAGGIVRYRCTFHSRLVNRYTCSGMCGVLTDRPLESIPPTVTIDAPEQMILPAVPPASLSTSVTLKGTASDDTAVYGVTIRLYDTTGKGTEYDAACTACDTPAAQWTLTQDLMPGSYVAEAIAADSSGNIPVVFPRVSFIVL